MKRSDYYALLLYFMLALFFWGLPMKFDFVNRLNISGDVAFYLWSLKWWPYAISHGINPFLTKAFWAPFGQNLAWTTSVPSIALSMWPITKLFGNVFSYNLITLISLTLSPFGIYLINRQLGLKESSSIFGGLVFFFSSYVWGQLLGHLNLYIVFIVIFLCYLYVLRFKCLIGRKTYIILFALLLAIQFGISNEIYTTFVVFSFFAFTILITLYYKNEDYKWKIVIMGVETISAVFLSVLLLLPYIYYIFYGYVSENINNNSFYVADLLNYIIPTPITWFLGDKSLSISSKFTGNFSEEGAYLGLPLIFIVMSFIYMTVKELYKQNKMYIFIVCFFMLSIILSFGPYLRILGHSTIPMPWIIFSELPLIKQALPTRFTLYVYIAAAIIAALWVEKNKFKNYYKYMISGLVLFFLIPNLSMYKGSYITYPDFITSGFYKRYIGKNENVIVFPTYALGGYQGSLWQQKVNFYFNLSQEIAGPAPKELINDIKVYSALMNFFYGETKPMLNNEVKLSFLYYILKCNVKAILIPVDYNDQIVNDLLRTLNKAPINVGGVKIYEVNPIQIKSLISILREDYKKELLKIYDTLFSSAVSYLSDGQPLSNLYPQYLEEHGYLDKSFGYETGPAMNWTRNSGWVGKWDCPDGKGSCFGVGITGNIEDLKPIIEKYKSQALQIFFPYPKVYNEDTKDKSGQLLIIFRVPKPIISTFPYIIDFKSTGNAKFFESSGFCEPEDWGTWSCVKEVSIDFDLKNYPKKPLFMVLDFKALVTPNHTQTFYFNLNGNLLKKLTTNNTLNHVVFDISKYLKSHNTLVIKIQDATTPKLLGINNDTRILGIGLIRLIFTK